MQSTMTLEAAVLTLKRGISEDRFAAAARSSERFLERQAGFGGRRLLREAGTGSWLDLVYWACEQDAARAMEHAKEDPLMAEFCSICDVVSAACYTHAALDTAAVGQEEDTGDDFVEFVTFKPIEGTNPDEYRELLAAVGRAALQVPGFRGRRLFRDDATGIWADLMRYDNREAAERLAACVSDSPRLSRVLAMTDPASVQVRFAHEAGIDLTADSR